MSLAFADVNPNEIGALAPMVGGDLHNMHHTKDIHGEYETTSWQALSKEAAPHLDSEIASKGAEVSAVASDGSIPIIDNAVGAAAGVVDQGVDKFEGFMGGVNDAAEATADVVIGGTAISAALLASAVDAMRDAFGNAIADQPSAEPNGLELNAMHVGTMVADMTNGAIDPSEIGQLSDPTLAISAAQDFMHAKQDMFALSV